MSLTLNENIKCGEHFKFIVSDGCLKTYELIASNDKRLLSMKDNITPYVQTNSFMLNDVAYESYIMAFYCDFDNTATLYQQFESIKKCLHKINGHITVANHNDDTITFVSKRKNTYIQHILPVNAQYGTYDYIHYLNKSQNAPLSVFPANIELYG